MRRAVLAVVGLLSLALLAFATSPGSAADDPRPTVRILYFRAQDDPLDQALLAAFEEGLTDVRLWYGRQVGKTFRFDILIDVVGRKTVAAYCADLGCQPASEWGAAFRAVVAELEERGYVDRSDPHSVYIVAVQTYEISSTMGDPGGPWFSSDGGGVSIVGRQVLLDIAAGCGDDCTVRNRALGMIAHELGHAFNLPHPHEDVYSQGRDPCDEHCSQTVMWAYPAYPAVGLLDTAEHPEKEALRRSPFFSLDVRTVHLEAGWNLVSLPLRPEAAAARSILSSLQEQWDVVYAWNARTSRWLSFFPGRGGTLDRLDETRGFWVHMKREAILSVVGEPAGPVSIPLVAGWNLIGYPADEPLPVAEALASIDGRYDAVYSWAASAGSWRLYIPGLGFSTLQEMTPGRAYWVHATSDAVLTVNEAAFSASP